MREMFDFAMTIVVAIVLSLIVMAVASAHEWYPMECCSGIDCAPVTEASSSMAFAAGVMSLAPLTITTKHGTAIVPADLTRRPSPDGRMHACIRMGKVICLFVPPGS